MSAADQTAATIYQRGGESANRARQWARLEMRGPLNITI